LASEQSLKTKYQHVCFKVSGFKTFLANLKLYFSLGLGRKKTCASKNEGKKWKWKEEAGNIIMKV